MDFAIGPEERRVLLALARESIASKLEGRVPNTQSPAAEAHPVLGEPCGAFVSLYKSEASGRRALRGCIGRLTANLPLAQTVHVMAREAAFGDPRFSPLTKEELPSCRIEISALSPMSVCRDPRRVELGVHGLYLTLRGRSCVLLPQVPVEQGWSLDEYLDYISIKAGLPAGSHEAPGARLETFTAVVFREEL